MSSNDPVEDFVVQNVFLPPWLPQQEYSPSTTSSGEKRLFEHVLQSFEGLKNSNSEVHAHLQDVMKVIHSSKLAFDSGECGGPAFNHVLSDVHARNTGVAIHVRLQNAGLIVLKQQDNVVFHSFELCPENSQVFKGKGRIRRVFPAASVVMSARQYCDPALQHTISHTIHTMINQEVEQMIPRRRKSGHLQIEDRDTTDPAMVTENFMSFLSAIGEVDCNARYVTKNMREEVLWSSTRSPWRRSGLWILLRITMQIMLPHKLYKEFMVYLLARILSQASKQSTDMLYAMSAKIERRLKKLGSGIDDTILAFIGASLQTARTTMSARWKEIQHKHERHIDEFSALSQLNFSDSTYVPLPSLDRYIDRISQRHDVQRVVDFTAHSDLKDFHSHLLPELDWTDAAFESFNLQGFESWVSSHLSSWMSQSSSGIEEEVCGKIGNLISDYHNRASKEYVGNPEAISMMLLTILDLWVSCDKAAIIAHGLVEEYQPGVPTDILQSLLIPTKDQLQRLARIEAYIVNRSCAKYPRSRCFDSEDKCSFGARYFETSVLHQKLRRTIEARAHEQREAKIVDFHEKKRHYDQLMQIHRDIDHSNITTYNRYLEKEEEHHYARFCRKCQILEEAKQMRIAIHEWPLPTNDTKAKVVVFELCTPPAFAAWRDITSHLLLKVLQGEYAPANLQADYKLASDPHLHAHFSSKSSDGYPRRICLLSEIKPNVRTHGIEPLVSIATARDVCLQNGLDYQYYDNVCARYVEDPKFDSGLHKTCMYSLPTRSLALQKVLDRPACSPDGMSTNEIVAAQYECPDHMALDEFKYLGGIPNGPRTQWLNLLLQLGVPSVDIKKEETTLVIMQCIHQAGPPSDNGSYLRLGHECIAQNYLVRRLLEELHGLLRRIKENWESAQAVLVVLNISSKLLSLNPSMSRRCLELLSLGRGILFTWVKLLRDKAQQSLVDEDRNMFTTKAVETALVCLTSFDVDIIHLQEVLKSEADSSVLIQCSITVQERMRTCSTDFHQLFALLQRRAQRILFRSYPFLAETHCGLDHAIKRSWPAFQTNHDWKPALTGANHWLMTFSLTPDGGRGPTVHYDLLSGKLLVNGVPLNRPPPEFEDHSSFPILFGKTAVEVMPSTVSGFQFSTKSLHAGYNVALGMASSGDLEVRAYDNSTTYELIPGHLFEGEYPAYFARDCVHWLDLKQNVIQFRKQNDPWKASSFDNWTLTRHQSQTWRLTQGDTSLVGLRTSAMHSLGEIFSPLADPSHIHAVASYSVELPDELEIALPTTQISFRLKQGTASLESKDFGGMVVDHDQNLSTLVGLKNKLVLASPHSGDRTVLIPEGKVMLTRTGNTPYEHTQVQIDKMSFVKVHAFSVDSWLKRLVDNGDLQSKLYVAYLHSLTSSCLPDPLTGFTGTERALAILRSAAVRSFEQLRANNIRILEQIANLAPARRFYPVGMREMQQIIWSNELGFMAQSNALHKAVQAIFLQAEETEVFRPNSKVTIPSLDRTDTWLRDRDSIRSSIFRVAGFGAEEFRIDQDIIYSPRDGGQSSERSSDAYSLSSLVFRGSGMRVRDVPAPGMLWQTLESQEVIYGYGNRITARLEYDALPSLPIEHWPKLHKVLSEHANSCFEVMIWLSTLAFLDGDLAILQILALMYTNEPLAERNLQAPTASKFTPAKSYASNYSELQRIVKTHSVALECSPEWQVARRESETKYAFRNRREEAFAAKLDSCSRNFADNLTAQWYQHPTPFPVTLQTTDTLNTSRYFDIDAAMDDARMKFEAWYNNLQLKEYLERIEQTIASLPSHTIFSPNFPRREATVKPSPRGFISFDDLFKGQPPSPSPIPVLPPLLSATSPAPDSFSHLMELIQVLEADAGSQHERAYVNDLKDSASSLCKIDTPPCLSVRREDLASMVNEHLRKCLDHLRNTSKALQDHFISETRLASGIVAGHLPRLTPSLMLEQLRRPSFDNLSLPWRRCLINYALSMSALQRAQRISKLMTAGEDDLVKEIANTGHTNWNPFDYPEILLMEVESGILIRPVQEQIASKMRKAEAGNVVMQLHMGEGKSSVIVPITVIITADGRRLVRVIVAKPQARQMAQMLRTKLGGMLNRRIFYMPFSRSLKPDTSGAASIRRVCEECMREGGVMLVQPEHLLSFQLMGVECLNSGREAVGTSLLQTQRFFDQHTRDIIDESDENFSVRFELIYTLGTQKQIEFGAERWNCVASLLDLMRSMVDDLAHEMQQTFAIIPGPAGSFPRLRILRSNGLVVFDRIARYICDHGLHGFPIARQSRAVKDDVFTYITKADISAAEVERTERPDGFWSDSTRSILLLLRGLIACGVLSFVFMQKRWRVNFGLTTSRTPSTQLAVPYRAKDNPSLRSEFSHPDVVVALTTLSYYYGGLDDEDLFTALGHLMSSDHAETKYQEWMRDAPSTPEAFRQLEGINLKDRSQCVSEVFPCIRRAKSVIDYFLSSIVFPKEMKEFPLKLSASGWDLGKAKTLPTTGFSGTIDNKDLLPIDVTHLDLPDQKHTDALVMNHLLQQENLVAHISTSEDSSHSEARAILSFITSLDPPVQVILDVGAQIIELDNFGVARNWLKVQKDTSKQAVVYLDDDDELMVYGRSGRKEPLQTSPFLTRLDLCLIFLDEAHTRGIDLQLPTSYRAAVTLGAGLSKDRLVQACMRMRKLGKGPTVTFCISNEISTKIQECMPATTTTDIAVPHVLRWAISETFKDIRRSMPLWVVQGQRFVAHEPLWLQLHTSLEQAKDSPQAGGFLEREAQSLDDRYRPRPKDTALSPIHFLDHQNSRLQHIAQHCSKFKDVQYNSSTLREEQERELAPEQEQQRQVQRPAPAVPLEHVLASDVELFASNGQISSTSTAYMPAFLALADISAAKLFDVNELKGDGTLYVTNDYARTIMPSSVAHTTDAYQKPIQWILSRVSSNGATIDQIMIISPFEAQHLIDVVKQSQRTALHLYKPRQNVAHPSLDNLKYFTTTGCATALTLPRCLAVQLDLFSGQLYLNSYDDYLESCHFLGLSPVACEGVAVDGFIEKDDSGRVGGDSGLTRSPVEFMRVLMTKIRRNAEDIAKTHIGAMLEGRILEMTDLESVHDAGRIDKTFRNATK